jgi:hypothetical protein
MKAKILYLLAIINFVLFKIAKSQRFSYDKYLICGVKDPKEADDCLVHSLSSGFDCCFITQLPNSKPNVCGLVAEANRNNTKLPIYQGPPYFECKASGYFMNFSLALLLLIFAI